MLRCRAVLCCAVQCRLAYLSGPSFAAEVAKEIPTAVTIACESDAVATRVQVRRRPPASHPALERWRVCCCWFLLAPKGSAPPSPLLLHVSPLPPLAAAASRPLAAAACRQELMSTPRFRCYRTRDVIGVELGGALKNVLAIACGISDGLGFGNNGRAALITRGLDEITRLAGGRA